MGKMKEVFIKDIEDNAQHITYDMLDHRDHIDDDYHYCKHLQKKAMKQFKSIRETKGTISLQYRMGKIETVIALVMTEHIHLP